MKRRDPPENTPLVIAVALAFFGAAAALGWANGVFALLSGEELAALAIFAAAFALLTYLQDRGVRATVNRLVTPGTGPLSPKKQAKADVARFSSAPARSPGARRAAP